MIWNKVPAKCLFGKTPGVTGIGAIWLELAKRWTNGMSRPPVALHPYAQEAAWIVESEVDQLTRFMNLEVLLRDADVMTLHVLRTPLTQNMLSKHEFDMKDDVILWNCARGGVGGEEAMSLGLRSGKRFGAG